jgi:hypothetical protein
MILIRMLALRLLLIAAVIAFLLVGWGPDQAHAVDTCAQWGFTCNWTRYASSNFPARVSAVLYADGRVLSRSRSITYGRWTVSFGSDVTAFYASRSGPDSRSTLYRIDLKGLRCTNAVVGEIPCTLELIWFSAGGKFCALKSDDLNRYRAGGDVAENIFWSQQENICPTDLRL